MRFPIFKSILLLVLICQVQPSAQAANVRMAFGEAIAPFCFPETNSGIELDIMREALAYRGHVLLPHYFPFARIPLMFKAGAVDAVMSDLGENLQEVGGFYGDPAVFYHNVFISLKERNLVIRKPDDLRGLTVMSFPGAAKRYPEWLDQVKKDGHYFEQNNQALQVLTLNAGRYDLVLSDRDIFRYFRLKAMLNADFHAKPVVEQNFVEINPLDYRPVFSNKRIRDDFNEGLKHLKATGRFNAIYRKYLGDQKE
jgi:polar amino acid transport system substrate-binding protein